MLIIVITALIGTVAVATAEPPYILGADISWIQEREAFGTKYIHNGQAKDMLDILKENKFNYIRLRIFVNPTATDPSVPNDDSGWNPYPYSKNGPYCGLDSTIKMAKRVKAAGMGFLLDFHYSDTWADPSKQYKPVSWKNLSGTALEEKVRSYTKESLQAFKNAGVLPDMVQVGNEVVHGMIHPDGKNNGDGFAKLVYAGINGVKDVDPNIKIMMHTINSENPSNWVSTLKTNLNKIEANAANKIDVIGLSYYPRWHGNVDSLDRSLNKIADQGYMVAVAEYADFHRQVNDKVMAIKKKNGKGLGTFVWEPQEFDGDTSKPLFSGAWNRKETNSLMALYQVMANDYGIESSSSEVAVSSSSESESSSSSSEDPSPILNSPFSILNSNSTYYTLKGEPLGSAKPQKNGVYIVKQGSSAKKIVVR